MSKSRSEIPLTSLLLKPAGPDCNLNCGYCFYLEKAALFPRPRHRMTEKILTETLRQALTQCQDGLSLSWQGGEPSLMGLAFYQKAVDLQERFGKGKRVGNAFQTNGVLMDGKWGDFFKKYKFLVGLSLDGPEQIHDHYRKTSKGAGSWETVAANAGRLLAQGVQVNAMTCLSDYSVRYPEEIYNFHKEMGLAYMQFIPILERGRAGESALAPFSITARQYGDFLCRIFDLWRADFKDGRPTTSVRLFESTFFRLLGQPNPQCTFRESCGQYLVVEHNGDVFPCDFFVEPRWKLGNVMEGNLTRMLNSERMAAFRELKSQLPEKCLSCQFRPFCHGGCTKDRAFDTGAARPNYFCEAYSQLFGHALPVLKALAARWH